MSYIPFFFFLPVSLKLDGRTDGAVDPRDKFLEFGFDYCYWSVDPADPHYASQEEVMSPVEGKISSCTLLEIHDRFVSCKITGNRSWWCTANCVVLSCFCFFFRGHAMSRAHFCVKAMCACQSKDWPDNHNLCANKGAQGKCCPWRQPITSGSMCHAFFFFYTDGHSGNMISAPSVTQKSLCLRPGMAVVSLPFMSLLWLGD